jgi:hypothetical protein
MGLNRAFDRSFFIIGGNVKTSGGSFHLAKGQMAVVNNKITTPDGVAVVNTFAGVPKKNKDFEIRVGIEQREPNRSRTNKAQATMPFSLGEVVDLRVSAPKRTEQSVDEVVIGWDGITPGSEFKWNTGDAYFRIYLELCGDAIGYKGGRETTEVVGVNIEIPQCDPFNNCEDCDECSSVDCKEIVLEAVERLKRKQITGGKTVADYIDITPIFDCDNVPEVDTVDFTYYTLDVCDTGSEIALALVQGQYNFPVIRVNRRGSISTYQVMVPTGEGVNKYEQTIASLIKGCEECPEGYVESEGGFLYAFTIADGGDDFSADIEALSNYVTGTVVKSGNDNGVGFYTAILSQPLTTSGVQSWLSSETYLATATVDLVGSVASICSDDTVTSIAWVEGDTCSATTELYSIILPDNECGEDRLAELQGAYPNLNVELAPSGQSTLTLTIAGTEGSANVSFGGVNYLITFNTSLTQTVLDFVNDHEEDLNAVGITLSADGATIVFTGPDALVADPGFAQVESDMVASTFDVEMIPLRQACQTKYVASVITNIVCDECDPIFRDYYLSKAPANYDVYVWVKEESAPLPSGNCKCGIRFKSRPFVIAGEEALRDIIQFTESSVQIRVAAGYPEEIREGIGRLPKGVYEGKYLSRWEPRTHLAGNLRDIENEGRAYFQGLDYRKDYLGRILTGEVSNMEDLFAQYVQYTLTVSHFNHAQGFAGRINEDINYHFFVEVGKHQGVENLLNDLAANAGVGGVQAFGA